MEDEFPRAFCHHEQVEERVMAFEDEHSTPVNDDDMREILMGVQAEFEDCDCECCLAT